MRTVVRGQWLRTQRSISAGGEAGHHQVEQQDVGVEVGDHTLRFQAIGGLAHDGNVGGLLECSADAGARKGVIVGEDNADGAVGLVHHILLAGLSAGVFYGSVKSVRLHRL